MLVNQESKARHTPSQREVTAQRTRQQRKMQSFHVLGIKAHVCFVLPVQTDLLFFFFLTKQTETRTCSSLRFMHFENNSEGGKKAEPEESKEKANQQVS